MIGDLNGYARFTITVTRGATRDENGDIREGHTFPVPGCLLSTRITDNPPNRSSATTAETTLYAPRAAHYLATPYRFESTDVITTPDSAPIAARWAVDGEPVCWPSGWEIHLNKE